MNMGSPLRSLPEGIMHDEGGDKKRVIPAPLESEPRVHKARRAAPADAIRPTRAEVNLEALRKNLRVVKKHADGAKVWAVLKADAYGHGAPAVARTLERAGADGFCVALLEEGVELREAGIVAPILVMGGYYGGAYAEVLARDMTPVIYDESHLAGFAAAARALKLDKPVDVHVKLDTGMARLGLRAENLESFADKLTNVPELRPSGLMTHLASADALSQEHTREQMVRFDEMTATLEKKGIRPLVRHAANSAALLRAEARLSAVRPGIALFGVSPRAVGNDGDVGAPFDSELAPVMRVRTEVVDVRTVPVGQTVGYGGLFRATRDTRVATVPMGYADGLSRQLSNRGHLLVRGKRAPIIGAVSMDMSMIDVTDIPGVGITDEVMVLGAQEGPQGRDNITADEVASRIGTIAWEVLTSISRRVPRFYREQ